MILVAAGDTNVGFTPITGNDGWSRDERGADIDKLADPEFKRRKPGEFSKTYAAATTMLEAGKRREEIDVALDVEAEPERLDRLGNSTYGSMVEREVNERLVHVRREAIGKAIDDHTNKSNDVEPAPERIP